MLIPGYPSSLWPMSPILPVNNFGFYLNSPATSPLSQSSLSSSPLFASQKILPVSGEDGEKFICPVCNASLLNLHDLTVHIRSHNTPGSGPASNSCKICGKVLSSQSSLDRHMLVHSGERPFICKVCNMSFTTNGNMHRHSRIHTKEENLKSLGAQLQMRRGKAGWRQKVNNFLQSQQSVQQSPASKSIKETPHKDVLKNLNLPNHSQHHSVFDRPTETQLPPLSIPVLKRPLATTASDWPLPAKRPLLDLSHKKAGAAYPIKSEPVDSDNQTEKSGDKEDKEVLHCPACPKTFLCRNGLASHIESHPELASHCALCNITLKNPQKLRLHQLIAHTEKETDTKDTKDVKVENGEKTTTEPKIGFSDLTFVDFSVEKFPLIAKHYFEQNSRMSNSAYLNFTCRLCKKSFPCESSLILHTYTHSKDKCTQCPICDCDYADFNEFHAHMLKHLSDKAFDEIRPSAKNEKGDEDLKPEQLAQQDFLAMFLLKEDDEKADQDSTTSPAKNTKSMKVEKNENNTYFPKLGQAYAPGIPAMFQSYPFPPGYQPTLGDFHKMLQLATNMNMLPSMGVGLLKSGLVVPQPVASSTPSKSGSISASSTPKPAHSTHVSSAFDHKPHLNKEEMMFSGPEREINYIKKMNQGEFACKYCDNVFPDHKSLKSHVRTHRGHAPYQCNLCVYSSTDKSSLIRHVRTHSGARPYQCLECNFAFTTRANCERHLRKKHGKVEREEVEKFLYLNQNALDSSSNLDSFCSPDTVCKFCNVDFKYFRSLKNHLRTHETSRYKPFKCMFCEIGFCTKLNAIRHLQKVHSEVGVSQMSRCVEVGTYPEDDDDSMCSDDGIPLYTEASPTFQPPAAHSSRHMSPNGHLSPLSHVSPAQSPLLKREIGNRVDTPLDFSMKAESGGKNGKSEETPMDLSFKKIPNHVTIAPKSSPMEAHYQCPYCPMGFSESGAVERHMKKSHLSHLYEQSMAQLTGIPIYTNDGKLLISPKINSGSNLSPGITIPTPGRRNKPIQPKGKSGSATLQGLQNKIKQKRDQSMGGESDLASVSTMMKATDPNNLNLKAFFMPVSTPDIPALLPLAPTPRKTSPPGPMKFPNIAKRPGVQITPEHCMAIQRELDNLQKEGDVDEAALSQVREMALSVKEEVVNSTPTGSLNTSATPSPAPQPMSENHTEDENSEDGSVASLQTSEKGEAPPKKKRNSYADSPHKLACPYCPRAFPWVSSLTRHLLTHTGQKPFKCPRCPVTFSTKSNRERHLIRKHGVNMLDPMSRQTMDRPYKCPLCVFSSFSTQSNLLAHYRDKHNGSNLPDNMSDIERMSPSAIRAATMEMEIRAAENPPQIDEASLQMAHDDEDDDLDNSVCSSEKMDEDSYTEMEKDDSMSEKSERTGSIPLQIPTVLSNRTSDCNESQKIAPHLMPMPPLHRPDGEIAIKQEIQEGWESPTTMKKNIERIIAEQKAIIEQKAEMERKIQSEIRNHIEAQKKIDEPAASPPMDIEIPRLFDPTKPFTGSAERIINPERDNYDVDKITECWKCKEMFPSRKSLVRHLKEHNIDLPFKCYLCDASFDVRVDCLNHQADAHDSDWSILKEKNKVNDIEQFSLHMDKVVENNCNKLDSGSVLEIPGSGNDESKMEVISADYNQRKVYCSLCPKRFWSLQDLRRHMRSHTGERPFECDICQKRFTLKHSMMRHRKKHVGAPPRSFDDEEDSNGGSDIGAKSAQAKTSTAIPLFSAFPSTYSISTSLGVIPSTQTLGNTFLFTPGLSGAQMILSGGGVANFVQAANTTQSTTVQGSNPTETKASNSEEASSTKGESKPPVKPSLDAVKKEFLDCDADMLHNLLGVESSAIEKMLDAADVNTAAKYLGMAEVS